MVRNRPGARLRTGYHPPLRSPPALIRLHHAAAPKLPRHDSRPCCITRPSLARLLLLPTFPASSQQFPRALHRQKHSVFAPNVNRLN